MSVERQPTRTGRQREERRFDQTQLRESHHGQLVHRDYAAHFFRWGWVARNVHPGEYVLDIGCGQDYPLAKVLTQRPGSNREHYFGVDLNRMAKKPQWSWATFLDDFDFTSRHKELLAMIPDGFDRVVCFEVIEHMAPEDGLRLLQAVQDVIVDTGTLYLSTPVFNGQAAANHIHEYTVIELWEAIEAAGFVVEKRVGTFASLNEIKHSLSDFEREYLESVKWWFSNDVLSTLLACNHPDQSRNNLWVCRPKK